MCLENAYNTDMHMEHGTWNMEESILGLVELASAIIVWR